MCRGYWVGGIFELYFFENKSVYAVNVISARYRDMTTQFYLLKFDDINVNDLWFQEDGATCHTALILSPFGDNNWPPRSCDI